MAQETIIEDKHKSKEQLIAGLTMMRQRVVELEAAEVERMEQFRQVINSISAHIYATRISADGSRTNLYISSNVEALTGYPLDKFTSDWSFWPTTVIHPDDHGIAAAQMEQLAAGKNSEVEYRLLHANGKTIWVRDSGRVEIKNSLKTVYGVVSDITERKRAEEEIRRRNYELTLLNQVIAASAADMEPAALLDTVCRELAITFNVCSVRAILLNEDRTTAVVSAERLAKSRPTTINNTFPIADNPAIQYVVVHKSPLVAEDIRTDLRFGSKNGAPGQGDTVSALLIPLVAEGEVMGALELASNNLYRFSAEEISLVWNVADQAAGSLARFQLDQTHRRLLTAIEQAADSIVITDIKGAIIYVNPAFEQITGYSRYEAIGENPRILKSGEHNAAYYKALWDTITAGEVWRGRLINKRKDGSAYTEEAIITPVRDKYGEIVNYIAIKHDITRQLQLEEQYRQAQKMEVVGQLAGGIAHNFNNMLTIILGYTELLLSARYTDNKPRRRDIEQIRLAAEQAGQLTRQLLTFSRQETIKPQKVNVSQIVANIEQMLCRMIGEDITLITNLAPDLPQIEADPGHIEQIVMNLAGNARDAMPVGGLLTLSTENIAVDEAQAAQHSNLTPGPYVVLTVADTGCGMEEGVQAHIFEPFYTTKEVGKGTGLGLATIHGIVQQYNGHIQVDSTPGQGTTFTIYFPYVMTSITETTLQPPMQPALGGKETILLVEDEEIVRLVVSKVLQNLGYTVLQANSGKIALKKVQRYNGRIDLVITDVIMPGMSGAALAKELAKLNSRLKILFMSGYTDDVLDIHGISMSDIMFLGKPFTPASLGRKVRETLQQGNH